MFCTVYNVLNLTNICVQLLLWVTVFVHILERRGREFHINTEVTDGSNFHLEALHQASSDSSDSASTDGLK